MKNFRKSALLVLMATCAIGFSACKDKAEEKADGADAGAPTETVGEQTPTTTGNAPTVQTEQQAPAATGEDDNGTAMFKTADVTDKTGNSIGVVQMLETDRGLVFRVSLNDLKPGKHGIHVHETGLCMGNAGFTTAGGHFNPGHKDHGKPHSDSAHAGDLGNLVVGDDGKVESSIMAPQLSLLKNAPAGRFSIYDADGSALIIHEGEDDFKTQPTGDAGGREACAVLTDANGDDPQQNTPMPN
ncbi:MAG: superoxide dismutase family protein [Pseudobdellovibrionaceae bacterium]